MPTPNKNTSINLYDDLQNRTLKMSNASLRKSVDNLRYANNLVDSRSLETKRESSKVAAYKSIFQKEKEEQFYGMSQLLNYKNKISIVKQNELFQKCLSKDKNDTIQKKYEIAKNVKREEERRLAELRRQSRTQPKVVMIAESSDSDSTKSFDPKKAKAV